MQNAAPPIEPSRPYKRILLELLAFVCFEGLLLSMYGFFVSTFQDQIFKYDVSAGLVLFGIIMLVLLGFGMLFLYGGQQSASGLLRVSLIISLTVQLYFLVNVLFTLLEIQPSMDTLANTANFHKWIGATPLLSKHGMNFSNAAGCSLTVFLSYFNLHRRISTRMLVAHTICVVFAWEINRQLFLRLMIRDSGGSMGIFLFGATAGIVSGKILGSMEGPAQTKWIPATRSDKLFAFIGVGFIWCFLPLYTSLTQTFYMQDSFTDPFVGFSAVNMWIALSFGLVWSFVASRLKYGDAQLRDLIFGSICGGIAFGSSSSIIQQPLSAIIVGVAAALVNTWLVPKFTFLKVPRAGRLSSLSASFFTAGAVGGLYSFILVTMMDLQTYQYYTAKFYQNNRFWQSLIQLAGTGIAFGIGCIAAACSSSFFWIFRRSQCCTASLPAEGDIFGYAVEDARNK